MVCGGALWACGPEVAVPREPSAATPVCVPTDSMWAIALRVVDAATRKPVSDAYVSTGTLGSMAVTDSAGWGCMRSLSEQAGTLEVSRTGYHDIRFVLIGATGQLVRHEVTFERVEPPCCDLRGRWSVTFHLDKPAEFHPNPSARTVTGEVSLGPRHHPPEDGDDLDSLVRVARGLHAVDFTPFFEGPVARDVSTSIFGSGPDLLREVTATIPSSDDVRIVFIPRMSHGSLSLDGRIRNDTIRGEWVQNAMCCGARGRFKMHRIGPVDTASIATPPVGNAKRSRRAHFAPPPAIIAAGELPYGRWRPELAVAPGGRLWLALGGLFTADSVAGPWRRVLGGPADPMEADDLRLGLEMAFVDDRIVVVGLAWRHPSNGAPSVYRTEDAGASWSSVSLPDVDHVLALAAIGPSVWAATKSPDARSSAFHRSEDGGKAWSRTTFPPAAKDITGLHRISRSVAYLSGSGDSPAEVFWRTTDGGTTWTPLPTPSDQGLMKLEPHSTRVEQVATAGDWLIVREHGKVFVSPGGEIRWRPLPGVSHIASEVGGENIFVLTDSLHPAFIDRNLRTTWQGTRLPIDDPTDIEQVLVRRGVAYVSEVGAIHEIRRGSQRVVRARE